MRRFLTVAALLALSACDSSKPAPDPREQIRRIAVEGPHETLSADQLARAYRDNEIAADERFKGKGLKVAGPISTIMKDKDGVPMVFLGPTPNQNIVGCAGVEPSNVARLKPGQMVWMKGAGAGVSSGLPMLLFCEVQ
jgi:hypothetical protein